jgi:hypothetical protein
MGNPGFAYCSNLFNLPLRDWSKHLAPRMAIVKSVPTEKNPSETEFGDIADNGHQQFLALNRDTSHLGNYLTLYKPNLIAIGIALKTTRPRLRCHAGPFVPGSGAAAIRTKTIQRVAICAHLTEDAVRSEDDVGQTQGSWPVFCTQEWDGNGWLA